MIMKKYLNYIFEGKIDELRVKYKDKVPEDVFNYFVSNMVKKTIWCWFNIT